MSASQSPGPRPAWPGNDAAAERDLAARLAHWQAVAHGPRRRLAAAYHRRLAEVFRFLIPPGLRVLEVGCAEGDLLAALSPGLGVGVDFSSAMVAAARARHSELMLVEGDAHDLAALDLPGRLAEAAPTPMRGDRDGVFDAVVLADLVNDAFDVQRVFAEVAPLCGPRSRLIVTVQSRLWEPLLRLAQGLGLARPTRQQNWLTVHDVTNLLRLAGFRVVQHREEVLLPLAVPLLGRLANQVLVRFWPFRHLALTNVLVARRDGAPELAAAPKVSVLVPARNESGNIAAIFDRTGELGGDTELLFVEGNSSDDTWATIEREIAARPERRARLLKQPGKGKGDAVRAGFAIATGDILLILDADLTVPPEDLPRFVDVLLRGQGDFVNGVRLVYPMEQEAMRFANLLGNKFFSLAFTWLLGQPLKDTLCGTKVMWRDDYQRLVANRSYFGDFDPFGDYDLLFGAAKQLLEITELPIRYRERTYGTTNIQRWRHGVLLLRMCVFAAWRLKFV
jgi:SAM-dependent methyltransferase